MSANLFDRAKIHLGAHCIHRATTPDRFEGGKWIEKTEDRDVILLAVSQSWAMVRRPRAVPYVCHIRELLPHD